MVILYIHVLYLLYNVYAFFHCSIKQKTRKEKLAIVMEVWTRFIDTTCSMCVLRSMGQRGVILEKAHLFLLSLFIDTTCSMCVGTQKYGAQRDCIRRDPPFLAVVIYCHQICVQYVLTSVERRRILLEETHTFLLSSFIVTTCVYRMYSQVWSLEGLYQKRPILSCCRQLLTPKYYDA